MTGESDHVNTNADKNPFLIPGSKVVDGYGTMLITSVGMSTMWGEMMSSISRDSNEQIPLQAMLNKLTSYIGKREVFERATKAKEKAAREALEEKGIILKSPMTLSDAGTPAVEPQAPSPFDGNPLPDTKED